VGGRSRLIEEMNGKFGRPENIVGTLQYLNQLPWLVLSKRCRALSSICAYQQATLQQMVHLWHGARLAAVFFTRTAWHGARLAAVFFTRTVWHGARLASVFFTRTAWQAVTVLASMCHFLSEGQLGLFSVHWHKIRACSIKFCQSVFYRIHGNLTNRLVADTWA